MATDIPQRHLPVLLTACLDALAIRADGRYLDGTYGRGGHSRAILKALGPQGRLLALDRDPEAVRDGQALAAADPRFQIIHSRFSELGRVASEGPITPPYDGLLLDLGVSSPQLDQAERGFSFLHDGPLDMRMDPSSGQPASAWLGDVAEDELADVLYHYGDERHSRRIARAICTARKQTPLRTTRQLAELIAAAHPRWQPGQHPATQSFQAIRIQINQELRELELALAAAVLLLRPGARLAVICFHSLEDRLMKRFFRGEAAAATPDPWAPVEPAFRRLGKAIAADADERRQNPRSRSAHLRVGVRQ